MGQIASRVHDKRLLRLIRSWLKAGVLENGLVGPTDEGTPQGGPISPLLSNLVLDQLDRELERRGHRFARYADDCNIYVRSRRAGQRLMGGLTRLLEGKLKLKVNREKSAVARPWERKFLGFSFTNGKLPKRRIAPQSKGPVRSSHPNPYSSNSWYQHRDHGSRAGPLPSGLARLFRLLPNPDSAGPFQQVDPASYTLCRL